jgi:3-phenylpropionate/trans-cinnamate dioxygenase ferredoxin reductase subunit
MSGNCIIVGAGHAGVALALQLRKEGWEGTIQLLSEEPELPYHRPPLSKEHLSGEKGLDAIRLRPMKAYEDNNIELLLSTTATRIDKESKSLYLASGESLTYDKLALCTGASVRALSLANAKENVFYIRKAEDVTPLSAQVKEGKRALIIGAGYIGLEAAAVLSQKGVNVTVLEMSERILQRVTGEAMSSFMQQLHESHGVEIRTAAEVVECQGENTIEKVVCADGSEFETDFLIVGIGVVANTALAETADLDVDRGIKVNEYGQTSDASIFAAGDCTVHPSFLYQRSIQLESVQNANDQARVVAANICKRQQAYDAVPWFWSDQYHIKLQTVGLNEGYDEVVCRGENKVAPDASFALFYLKEGVLIAADCIARPKEFMVSKKLVKDRVAIAATVLQDESIEPVNFTS